MGTTAPEDYLVCDGAVYDITEHQNLAALFAEQFGEANHFGGDGEITFAVPDLQGRFLLGSSETYPLGDTGGEETHKLTVSEMPSHHHMVLAHGAYSSGNANYYKLIVGKTDTIDYLPDTKATGYDQPHNNMPPYMSVLHCIKAK